MGDADQEEGLRLPPRRAARVGKLTRFKLLVTDLDGTLLAPSGEVHERDRQAIGALGERGVAVSLCTGRMYSGTRAVAESLGLTSPVGCLDGSHIVDPKSHADLVHHPIAEQARDALRDALADHGPATFLFTDDAVLHDERGEQYLPYVEQWSTRCERLDRLLDRVAWPSDERLAAVVGVGSETQIRGAAEHLESKAAPHVQAITFSVGKDGYRGVWGMIVRAKGVSKGTALQWMAEQRGIGVEEVVAVGDWINDVSMLRAAGRSFAMAQAPDAVKSAATDVLDADAWTGGGIAEAAERAGLL